ncbi:hypothetical protein BDV25DRAFT_147542 [Aspergillus avenaceus]|uniref:DUF2306 domain-containing protein n=1 Tax=Aspergillus avenaceus TaxID=36643 RepID=A0A5N6U7G9_ASPAV|nr:hypothetical protein BDV25DRAFT_147542 [Aspergillus avenaceus]
MPSPTPNAFVRRARKIYTPLGFKKGYNFTLFFIFGGAWLGFTLARLQFLNFSIFCQEASPGECFYYKDLGYVGLYLHLGCILPGALLAFLQFIPAIRYKAIIIHRINGYIIILLVIASNIGALMIARHAFGGLISTQAAVGFLVILTTTAMAIAYYNIKRLQIEQHRAWMLRSFFYMGSIITVRIILITAAVIISKQPYFMSQPCDKIDYLLGEQETLQRYPVCGRYYNGSQPDQHVSVLANFNGYVDQIASALNANFGMALWLAVAMHGIGVEVYLQLTPRESNRLREVSYQRQLEAGFENPGRAGLTVDKIGDGELWVPGKTGNT